MSDEELKVPEELFKDVKFYVVGDIDQKVVQLLKAGKAKEVSYNALATHIIAEDGDNPEVGESREVFDLPVVKPSWVILSVRCGDLLPATGFSPEPGQVFFGVTACLPRLPEDLNSLWALITFHGGDCQLNLNKKCTHLVVTEPKGISEWRLGSMSPDRVQSCVREIVGDEKYEWALKHSSIKIVTPEWILDSVAEKSRRDEVPYHPRLTYREEEEEEEEEESEEECDRGSRSQRSSPASSRDASPLSTGRGPSPKTERRGELMFDDSSDSSPEKEDRNLNWTPADVPQPAGAKRRLQPGRDSGLINLCASVPPLPGVTPPDGHGAAVPPGQPSAGSERSEVMGSWSSAPRTLRNITNNADIQQGPRPPSVAHILQSLSTPTKLDQQAAPGQPGHQNPLLFNQVKPQAQPLTADAQQQPAHGLPQPPPQQHQQHHPLLHLQGQQLMHQPQQQGPPQGYLQQQQQQQQQHLFLQQPHQQQMFSQQLQQQQQPHPFMQQQQLRPQQILRPPLQQQQLQQQQQQQHVLQQQLLQQHRLQLQLQHQQQHPQQNHPQQNHQQQQQQLHQQQLHQQHLQHQQHLLQQQLQQQHMQQLQQQQQQQNSQQQPLPHQAALQPLPQQLFGHEPGLDIPEESCLSGCVFAIADYPEQMPDKQLLATWKRIIQLYGGTVESSPSSRCTHLLCESQVSSTYLQALREGKRCVTAHWLNTVLKKKKMVPPHRTLHLPFAFPPGAKPCSQHIISVTGFVDTDRDDLKLMAYLAGGRYTGYLCRSNTVLICKEPRGLKYEKAKEWRIPCVNAQWLCDVLLGNFEALRQIQHSRYAAFGLPDPLAPSPHLVPNLLAAWRNPVKISQEVLVTIRLQQKQKQSEASTQPPAKKPRLDELPAPLKKLPAESTPYVLFTGFEPVQVQLYTKRLYELGGEVAENTRKCTHLIASKVTRTVKFLTAISVVKCIVTPEWLEESWKSQKFVDEQNFILRDAEAEVLFCFSLEESLKRAHATPLFKGKYFYITPGICPSLTTMKSIVECAGGKVLAKQPSFRKVMEHKQNKSLSEIILISCENDLHLCREYFLKNIDVHNAEFVLTGVLTQTLDYDSYKFT